MLTRVDKRDLVLLADECKESQISKSISVQSLLISDPFSWKRVGLAKVGVGKRHRSGQNRVVKVRAAESQGGKPLGGLRLDGQTAKSSQRVSPLF